MDDPKYGRDEPVQHSWPDLTCYGCGPANPDGLQLKSYLAPDGERLVAQVQPDEVFTSGAPNVMYGGHVASLIDCHSIWTAITFAYRDEDRPLGSSPRIAYVTGTLCVEYHEPTPLDREIRLDGWIEDGVGRRTTVQTELGPDGRTTATGEVVAVRVDASVRDGHHRSTEDDAVGSANNSGVIDE